MNTAAITIDALIQQELLAARSGDHGAYGRIVAACQNTVTAVALAITRDVATSEDIAQEAFLSAWQHLEKLHSPDSFLPWLRQITRNLARDHLHKYRHQPLDGPNAELVMALAADPGPQPMQRLLEGEREMTAAELIAALPEESRETLLLFYREGQSSQQVAALLGTTDAAVRKRLSRARQLVRDDMLKRFGEFAHSSAPSAAFAMGVTSVIATVGKSAAAASVSTTGVAAAGAATIGTSILGKGAFGIASLSGFVAINLLISVIYAHFQRKHLHGFADTLEERAAIDHSFRTYFHLSIWPGLIAFVVAGFVPGLNWTLAASLLVAIAFSYATLVTIRGTMKPMLLRDAVRDPKGARKRRFSYECNFGIVVNAFVWIAYPLAMALIYKLCHEDVFSAKYLAAQAEAGLELSIQIGKFFADLSKP